MLLFTDGGSTKCDWVGLDQQKQVVFTSTTSGLNPSVLNDNELEKVVRSLNNLQTISGQVTKIDFYGAGCGSATYKTRLKKVLKNVFLRADVNVEEDTLAAVRSVTTKPALVCILGTGSNSCYFDGNKIHQPIPSLGYILMDEGSGNYFGKQLLRDYFYKSMPETIYNAFKENYNLLPDVVKQNLYQKPNPNAYLASFASFVFSQPDVDGYFYNMLTKGLSQFIKKRVLCFQEASDVPIHFVGSIAYFSKEILTECLENFNLQVGKIIQKPIDGLVSYYQEHRF